MCASAFQQQNLLTEVQEFLPKDSLKPMSQKDSEKVLLGKKGGSYLFRIEESGEIYLSGVDVKGEVHHARIEKTNSQYLGINFGNYRSDRLNTLVCLCLKCKPEEMQLVSATDEG